MPTQDSSIRETMHKNMRHYLEHFSSTIPYATHLADAVEINESYFIRHQIEIIVRLRMKRTIDALTIHYFTKSNPVLAKKWAGYTDDEMLHDTMFIKDLEKFGIEPSSVYATEPLLATKLLQGYFYYGLEHEGKPLASLVSSYFIEYMSTVVLPQWNRHVAEKLGDDKVRGSTAHVDHDLQDSHVDFVWNVLETFIKSPADEQKVLDHLRNIYQLFCLFYEELYAIVVTKTPAHSFFFGQYLRFQATQAA